MKFKPFYITFIVASLSFVVNAATDTQEPLIGVNLASQLLGAKVTASSQWGFSQSGDITPGMANDGSFETTWAPGTGFGVVGDYLLLDMGQKRKFNHIAYYILPGEWMFPKYKVEIANNEKGPWSVVKIGHWTEGSGNVNINLQKTVSARFVKLTALEVRTSGRWPNIQEIMVVLFPPSKKNIAFSVGYPLNGHLPTNVIDGKDDTYWQEDHPAWLTVKLVKPQEADCLYITYPADVNTQPVVMNILMHKQGEPEDVWHGVLRPDDVTMIIQPGVGKQYVCFDKQTVDAFKMEFQPVQGSSAIAISEVGLECRKEVVKTDLKINLIVPRPGNSRVLETAYGPQLAMSDRPTTMLADLDCSKLAAVTDGVITLKLFDDKSAVVGEVCKDVKLFPDRKNVFEMEMPKLKQYGMVNAYLEMKAGDKVLSTAYARYPYIDAATVGTRPDNRLGLVGTPLQIWAANGKNFRQSFYWAELLPPSATPDKPLSWKIPHPVFNVYTARAVGGMIQAQNVDLTQICLLTGEPEATRIGPNFNPKYAKDFGNFAKSVAYKTTGFADYYEVLNEIENASPESYVPYFMAAYDSIRQVEPAAKFTITGMSGPNAAWHDKTISLIGADKVSAINYHLYNWGTDDNCIKLVSDMERVAVKHGGMKHFITEMGYFSSIEPLKTAHILRAAIISMACGADMIIEYAAMDSRWSLLRADGVAAGPYIAWMTLAYNLAGLNQSNMLNLPKPAYGAKFTDGKRTVYVLWQDEMKPSKFSSAQPVEVSIPLPVGNISIGDVYGNKTIVKHNGGEFKIAVTPMPIFVESASAQ